VTYNFAPFIDGSYGVTIIFLLGIGVLTFARYRRAAKRLAQAETRR
jgi:hypothetical protein